MKTKEFVGLVSVDIKKCEEALSNGNNNLNLLMELHGRYSMVSPNYPDVNTNPLMLQRHPNWANGELRKILGFLTAYYVNNCEDYNFQMDSPVQLTANITNQNTNQNNISFSFEEAERAIENMAGLREKDISDALAKISEIKEIFNSQDRKSKKWEKVRDILTWLADKSVDVGIAFLPLLMKIGT